MTKKDRHYNTKMKHVNSKSKSTSSTNIGLLNAHSVKNKTYEIVSTITDFQLDILMITETWLKPEDDIERRLITPTGYKIVHADRMFG